MPGSHNVRALALHFFGLSTIVLLLSCGIAPPKDTAQQHIFEYIQEVLQRIDQAEYARQAQGKAASLYKKVPYILYAHKGEEIIFRQEAIEPPKAQAEQGNPKSKADQENQADTLLYPVGDGSYRLSRDMYLAAGGDLFSFDRKNWYLVRSAEKSSKYSAKRSAKEAQPNLSFRIRSQVSDQAADQTNDQAAEQTTNQKRRLLVRYRAELLFAKQMTPLPHKKTKYLAEQTVQQGQTGDFVRLLSNSTRNLEKLEKRLQKNNSADLIALQALMAKWQNLSGVRGKGREIDLEKTILYFPKGMKFVYSFTLLGNLIRAHKQGRELRVTFLRDIYFYYPRNLFAAISFDNKYWGSNYFQFRIMPFTHSVFTSPESLSYFDGLYLEKS